MPKPVISVEHLTKRYELGVIGTGTLTRDLERWWARVRGQPDPYTRIGREDVFKRIGESILALDNVSFTVEQGEALGIIGKNGAGKSTLLKILSRVTAPTSGVVKVKGRIGSLLEVGTGFHPELTGRENVYLNGAILGMKKDEVARKFDEIVDFSGVEKFIDTPVKRYSSGMYVRLAFAVAAHLDPEILIVDEVLAVGDAEFQKKCLGKMGDVTNKEGRTVLFVSHNMAAVEKLCQSCVLLNSGQIAHVGDTSKITDIYLSDNVNFDNYHSLEKFRTSPILQNFIKEIHFLSPKGNKSNKFLISDDIHIEIIFSDEIHRKDNPYIGIGVNNHRDNRVFTLMSYNRQNPTEWEKFKKVQCTIPQNNLMPGLYTIKIVLNFGNIEKDVIQNYPAFEIISHDFFGSGRLPNQNQGVVIKNAIWNYFDET